jgi:nitroreductase
VNPMMTTLLDRRSVRAYQERPIPAAVREEILRAVLRAPTAGNMMLYSVIEIAAQPLKERLAETCDHQPFIAAAPWVLLFLADYQRWFDYFEHCGVPEYCAAKGQAMRRPAEGDLFLACCDALIAAQTAVVAAESHGLGSCYIGDIMENYEVHRELLQLPQYVFPITMVCFGYPTEQQRARRQPSRFPMEAVVYRDGYRRLNGDDFAAMFRETAEREFHNQPFIGDTANIGQHMYVRKFNAGFMLEMNRSVRAILRAWREEE